MFDGEATLRAALAEAPGALTPLEALLWAFRSVEQLFEDCRSFSEPRQKAIANTPALRERELAKAAGRIP